LEGEMTTTGEPEMILLADPTINVERQTWGELAVVVIRLVWPMTGRPDMVIPLTVPTAKMVANALVDCARPVDLNEDVS
jgi:hypothetical protein